MDMHAHNHAWLLENCSKELFHGKSGYRLGDMMSPYWRNKDPMKWSKESDGFIAALSKSRVQGGFVKSYAALAPLIRKRAEAGVSVAPNQTAVVHLRTGDVLDCAKCPSVHTFLCQWTQTPLKFGNRTQPQLYAYPLQHWATVASQLRRRAVRALTIISASHRDGKFPKSCAYIHAVAELFNSHGLQVDLRLGRDPEEDVVFASTAAYFASSGGGYSSFLAKLVERHGGSAIERTPIIDALHVIHDVFVIRICARHPTT
mmetsp:Transcript_9897/g.16488  ORF Transcript_9897/g.16488 Transcript_9897/m.16488 type:complete len:259 (-) Transcript_9897:121-897(-)|eukprot:CAMPEP_0119298392 /NCGR_PEP_ID=MMETSP1333-20130426/591_1 /TAXON_ID=418940 /ORGANISM="Scyphosphaera apsteinii, Strain RCC1455" /LENGTH=258 /DNA_ID=CAMNT_0007299487 /DNA_START=165 /DNA_END=941 /DNA_ORIENTATION=+